MEEYFPEDADYTVDAGLVDPPDQAKVPCALTFESDGKSYSSGTLAGREVEAGATRAPASKSQDDSVNEIGPVKHPDIIHYIQPETIPDSIPRIIFETHVQKENRSSSFAGIHLLPYDSEVVLSNTTDQLTQSEQEELAKAFSFDPAFNLQSFKDGEFHLLKIRVTGDVLTVNYNLHHSTILDNVPKGYRTDPHGRHQRFIDALAKAANTQSSVFSFLSQRSDLKSRLKRYEKAAARAHTRNPHARWQGRGRRNSQRIMATQKTVRPVLSRDNHIRPIRDVFASIDEYVVTHLYALLHREESRQLCNSIFGSAVLFQLAGQGIDSYAMVFLAKPKPDTHKVRERREVEAARLDTLNNDAVNDLASLPGELPPQGPPPPFELMRLAQEENGEALEPFRPPPFARVFKRGGISKPRKGHKFRVKIHEVPEAWHAEVIDRIPGTPFDSVSLRIWRPERVEAGSRTLLVSEDDPVAAALNVDLATEADVTQAYEAALPAHVKMTLIQTNHSLRRQQNAIERFSELGSEHFPHMIHLYLGTNAATLPKLPIRPLATQTATDLTRLVRTICNVAQLSEEQIHVVDTVIFNRSWYIAVSGAPGTGKTAILATIFRLLITTQECAGAGRKYPQPNALFISAHTNAAVRRLLDMLSAVRASVRSQQIQTRIIRFQPRDTTIALWKSFLKYPCSPNLVDLEDEDLKKLSRIGQKIHDAALNIEQRQDAGTKDFPNTMAYYELRDLGKIDPGGLYDNSARYKADPTRYSWHEGLCAGFEVLRHHEVLEGEAAASFARCHESFREHLINTAHAVIATPNLLAELQGTTARVRVLWREDSCNDEEVDSLCVHMVAPFAVVVDSADINLPKSSPENPILDPFGRQSSLAVMDRLVGAGHTHKALVIQHRIASQLCKEIEPIYPGISTGSCPVIGSPNEKYLHAVKKIVTKSTGRIGLQMAYITASEKVIQGTEGSASQSYARTASIAVYEAINATRNGISSSSIIIIAPYIAERRLVRNLLDRRSEGGQIRAFTADEAQGSEALLVIISWGRGGDFGFLGDRRRLAIMLTRAMCGIMHVVTSKFWDAVHDLEDSHPLKAIFGSIRSDKRACKASK